MYKVFFLFLHHSHPSPAESKSATHCIVYKRIHGMAFISLVEKMRVIWKNFEAELITARDNLCFLLLGKVAKEKE